MSERRETAPGRGQTYGEACDEVIAEVLLTLAKLEREAVECRARGEFDQADALEDAVAGLEDAALELVTKRQQMPFSNLSDDQFDAFLTAFTPTGGDRR